jgi:hypothetical protein
MQANTKINILRLAIILTIVVALVTAIAGLALDDTLPAELAQFVRARKSADLTDLEAVAVLANFLIVAALLVGLIGLWWVKRWARLLFTISAILSPPLWMFAGFVSGLSLVSTPIELGMDTALNMGIGAILTLIWIGMSEEFKLTERAE